MFRINTCRNVGLWAFELVLISAWISTVISEATSGNWIYVGLVAVLVTFLIILFFAEGIEIAVADLIDKSPETLSDSKLRETLAEIQDRSGFFFSQRQVFVVAIISFITLATSFDRVACRSQVPSTPMCFGRCKRKLDPYLAYYLLQ